LGAAVLECGDRFRNRAPAVTAVVAGKGACIANGVIWSADAGGAGTGDRERTAAAQTLWRTEDFELRLTSWAEELTGVDQRGASGTALWADKVGGKRQRDGL